MTDDSKIPALTFGNGNIILTKHSDEDGVRLIMSGSPRPFNIGTVKGVITDEELTQLVPLLMLKFTNIESVDVVIQSLQVVRRDKFFESAGKENEDD